MASPLPNPTSPAYLEAAAPQVGTYPLTLIFMDREVNHSFVFTQTFSVFSDAHPDATKQTLPS
jgi:hypothetical protein